MFGYSIELDGTATLQVHLEADITLSYDTADIVAGGSLPLHLTYTPRSSSASVGLVATATVNFWQGCGNCPATLHVSAWTTPMSFTPPLDADSPVRLPISSSTIVLRPLFSVDLGGSFTLSPVTYWRFPGLGGASVALTIDNGASITGGLPIVEWDRAGQTRDVTIQLPNPLPADFHLTLMPVLHWLGTSADIRANIHCIDALNIFSDPYPQGWPIFSGNLGPQYQEAGLDTRIRDAIPNALARDLVVARIRAGSIPVPLLQPPWTIISASANAVPLGQIVFDIQSPIGFFLFALVTDYTVLAGQTASYAIVLTFLPGAPPTVTLSVDPATLPKGAAVEIDPNIVFSASGTATLDVFTGLSSLGDSSLTIQGEGGGVTHATTVNLHVYDFSADVSPLDETIHSGDSAFYTVTLTLLPGSSLAPPAMSLSVSNLPSDATGTLGSASVAPALSPGASTTLTVVTAPPPGGSVGDFPFTVTATDNVNPSGGHRQADPANLHILAGPPPYTFTTWTGAAGDGRWETAGNWDNGVPTSGIGANIPHDAFVVTISTAQSVLYLGVGAGDTLICTATCSLTVVLGIPNGILGNLGTISNSGTITTTDLANAGGTLTNSGTVTVAGTFGITGTVVNFGTITISGEFANFGTFTNECHGTVNKAPIEGNPVETACAPVGGLLEPVNKLAVFAPYLALFGVLAVIVVAGVPWKRREKREN